MNQMHLEKWYRGQRVFTTSDVWEILDIKRGRLQEWIKGEFILYSKVPYGKRVQTVFSLKQLYSVALFQLLKDSGFDRKRASSYSVFMVGKWDEAIEKNQKYMIINFGDEHPDPLFSKSKEQMKNSISGTKLITILNLVEFMADIDKKISKIE